MNPLPDLHNFITSLLFTIVIESIVLFVFLRFIYKKSSLSVKQIIFAGIFASFATLPYVSFVFPRLFIGQRSTSLFFAELFAVIVEAIFYRVFLKVDWRIAFTVSVICNIASYYLGHLLHSNGIWLVW